MQVGIIGGSSVDGKTYAAAEEVGRLLASRGATVIGGGLSGVMEASAKGAKSAGGTTIGIVPGSDKRSANSYIDHIIATDMGHARNVIIVHTSDALIAIGGEYGTLSEIAIALKLGKKVISLDSWDITGVKKASSPEEAVSLVLG
ncbi:MAG: TIGR00725 family protein [Deltaproteobacteria bacterium]|jgi:uncharacterized protein (TIGR00725 family)|nr:TIGR00725 family protein [Deltaproteobacteria bacterium]